MLRKVKLYGKLAEFVGNKEFDVEADTVGKAVSFLVNNFEGLEAHMTPKKYQVKVGNYDIDSTEIHYPVGKEDIHFVPVIEGAGGSVGRILLGGALIALSFGAFGAFGSGALTFGKGFGASFKAAKFFGAKGVFLAGSALVLGGVSELLFPLPEPQKFNSEEDPQLSFNFSGTQNTSRAGTPIPLVYGEIITGSVVISAAIDTNQVEA